MASISSPSSLTSIRPTMSVLAKAALPSEVSTEGLADGAMLAVGKLGNHMYQSYVNIAPAHEAIAAVPHAIFGAGSTAEALGGVGKVLGHAGLFSGLISGVMSLAVHGYRYFNHQETGARAFKEVAIDTGAGAAGGLGAALLAGASTALVGALGLAGLPLTIVGVVAGFIGYSWLDNLVRAKVLGVLDYLHDRPAAPKQPATPATPAVPPTK